MKCSFYKMKIKTQSMPVTKYNTLLKHMYLEPQRHDLRQVGEQKVSYGGKLYFNTLHIDTLAVALSKGSLR